MKTALISSLVLGIAAMSPSSAMAGASSTTIASIVAASGGEFDNNANDFDILLNALSAAGLVDAVANAEANLTVFAPNDRAFKWLASDLGWTGDSEAEAWDFLVAALTQLGGGDPIPVLTNVLLYHVVGEELLLPQVIGGGPITTLLGATITPRGTRLIDNEPDLANPRLLMPKVFFADNGVIYTIDRVLIPIDLP